MALVLLDNAWACDAAGNQIALEIPLGDITPTTWDYDRGSSRPNTRICSTCSTLSPNFRRCL